MAKQSSLAALSVLESVLAFGYSLNQMIDLILSFWPVLPFLLVVWLSRDFSRWTKVVVFFFSLACSSSQAGIQNNERNAYYSTGGDFTTHHVVVVCPAAAASGSYVVFVYEIENESGPPAYTNNLLVRNQFYVNVVGATSTSVAHFADPLLDNGYFAAGDNTVIYYDVTHAWQGSGLTGNPFADAWFGQSTPITCGVAMYVVDGPEIGIPLLFQFGSVTINKVDVNGTGVDSDGRVHGSINPGGAGYTGVFEGTINQSIEVPSSPTATATLTQPAPPEYVAPNSPPPPTETPPGGGPVSPTPGGGGTNNNNVANPGGGSTNIIPVSPNSSTTPAGSPAGSVNNGDGTTTTSSSQTSTTFVTNITNGTNTVTSVVTSTSSNQDTAPTPPTTPTINNSPIDPGGGAAAQPPTGLIDAPGFGDAIKGKLPSLAGSSFSSSAQATTYDLVFASGIVADQHYYIHFDRTPFPELRSLFLVCFNITLIMAIYRFMKV